MIAVFTRIDGKLARYHIDSDDVDAARLAVETELLALNPSIPVSPVLALIERQPIDQPAAA